MGNKRILLGAEHTILDPLALFYLSDIARQEGWDPKIVLSRGPEYSEFKEAIQNFRPDVFGVTIYTGNHSNIRGLFNDVKSNNETITTVAGGPHPTYFPLEVSEYSDFVVMGEGFNAMRRILEGKVNKGIIPVHKSEKFPSSDRRDFYRENPIHGENPIKNLVTGTGCFFNCTHCYNSNNISDVAGVSSEQIAEMENAIGSKRFFPPRQRTVDEVMREVEDLRRVAPRTKMIFLEDDIFGGNISWLEEFTRKYDATLPFHSNMRFELIDPKKDNGRKRIDLLKKAGCTGLSLAIESGEETIRREVLRRNTPEDLMFDVFEYMSAAGLKARTYQMIGLPYGATQEETKINLDADLETLGLNVRLREATGLPTITWAATLAPYPGTKIAQYCEDHGFYHGSSGKIIGAETYRIKSVLRHPRKWVGPSLSGTEDLWLGQQEQEKYRDKLKILMDYFPVFALIPGGDKVARDFLDSEKLEFSEIYHLMKGRGVFEKIPKGDELEAKLKDYTPGGIPDRNAMIRYHMYDNDLFSLD